LVKAFEVMNEIKVAVISTGSIGYRHLQVEQCIVPTDRWRASARALRVDDFVSKRGNQRQGFAGPPGRWKVQTEVPLPAAVVQDMKV